jgi:hypothetical protein
MFVFTALIDPFIIASASFDCLGAAILHLSLPYNPSVLRRGPLLHRPAVLFRLTYLVLMQSLSLQVPYLNRYTTAL